MRTGEGKVVRNAEIRLVRDGIVIHEGKISSLKRFKDDAKKLPQATNAVLALKPITISKKVISSNASTWWRSSATDKEQGGNGILLFGYR